MQLLSDTRTGRRQRLSFSYQLPTQGRRNQGCKGAMGAIWPPPDFGGSVNQSQPGEAEAKIELM